MKVELIAYTPDADKIVAAAAKLCYAKSDIAALMEKLTPDKVKTFLDMLIELGHESPVEHASFTFGIEGVSRALLAQITRHRIASYSVQSQRYVDKSNFEYIIPPKIAENPLARAEFEQAMAEDSAHYERLKSILFEAKKAELVAEGVAEADAASIAEKAANEDARFVLPNACDTRMIMTMNVRSLWNFFNLRCCMRAQWEIKALAVEMLKLCKNAAPLLFKFAGPPCVYDRCGEGSFTCGKIKQVREEFKNL